MYQFIDYSKLFSPEEVLGYFRKSRDEADLSTEEVLSKHQAMVDAWTQRNIGGVIPQENRYFELVSGETIAERKEFQKVLRLIENPQYRAIACFDVARLSRGDLEDAGRLIKLFRYTDTYIITMDKVYDLKDESDREKFERELKKGNEYLEYFKKISNAGRLLSVQQGNYIGSHPPYGFDRTTVMDGNRKCHTLKENPEQANVVRLIFDLYVNKDMGAQSIAYYLDEMQIPRPTKRQKFWSPATLNGIIKNVHYIGKVKWFDRRDVIVVEEGEIKKMSKKSKQEDVLIFEGKHDAIIDEEIFYKAQEKIGSKPRKKPKTTARNMLAGLLFCRCGKAMALHHYQPRGDKTPPPRLTCTAHKHCDSSSILYDEMIEKVREILENAIEDFEIKLKNDDRTSENIQEQMIKSLEKKLKDLRARELSQWEAQSNPDESQRMPQEIFRQLNEKLLKEKEETQKALKIAYENLPEPIDYRELIERFTTTLEALDDDSVDVTAKNSLLKNCIEKITYYRYKAKRIKSRQTRYYDKERKITRYTSPLSTGGNWTQPQIELDVKLKV